MIIRIIPNMPEFNQGVARYLGLIAQDAQLQLNFESPEKSKSDTHQEEDDQEDLPC